MDIQKIADYAKKGRNFRKTFTDTKNDKVLVFNNDYKNSKRATEIAEVTTDSVFTQRVFVYILWILHDPVKAIELKYKWSVNGYAFLFLENFVYLIKSDLFLGILFDILENYKKISKYALETAIDNIFTQMDSFRKSIESFIAGPINYKKKILEGVPIWYVSLAIKKFYDTTQMIEDNIYKSPVIGSIDKTTMYRLSDEIFQGEFNFFGLTKYFYKAGSTLNDDDKKKINEIY